MVRFGVKSDRGKVREINEDSYNVIAGYPGIPVTFIIADGMGGHNSGEIASKTAVDYVSNYILQSPGSFLESEDLSPIVKKVMEEANTDVYKKSLEHEGDRGMGTTLIVTVVHNKKLTIGHVGDSRVYMIRDDSILRLTEDHSFIEELVKNGTLTREEAENHPNKNLITRALGCSDSIQVDTYKYDLKDDDVCVVCTDGLTNMLGEKEIKDIVLNSGDPEIACDKLIMEANERGGEDNITVIVFRNTD
jgi:protein phosphatase